MKKDGKQHKGACATRNEIIFFQIEVHAPHTSEMMKNYKKDSVVHHHFCPQTTQNAFRKFIIKISLP